MAKILTEEEYNELVKRGEECDQLKARVYELEEVLRDEFTGHPHTCLTWSTTDMDDCTCDARIAVEVLNRNPPQSLSAHYAAFLRNYAKDWNPPENGIDTDWTDKEVYEAMMKDADLIERGL